LEEPAAYIFKAENIISSTMKMQLMNIDIVACRPLLGSDRETNNETTSYARQQILDKQICRAITE
jgi:hypothetical protein